MRHAALNFGDKPNAKPEQIILILSVDEGRQLVELSEAAAKANPRKTTWARLAKQLANLECW